MIILALRFAMVFMGDETYYPWTPNDESDWLLMAAAPALLEALEAWKDYEGSIAPNHSWDEVHAMVDAAIAKAKPPAAALPTPSSPEAPPVPPAPGTPETTPTSTPDSPSTPAGCDTC